MSKDTSFESFYETLRKGYESVRKSFYKKYNSRIERLVKTLLSDNELSGLNSEDAEKVVHFLAEQLYLHFIFTLALMRNSL